MKKAKFETFKEVFGEYKEAFVLLTISAVVAVITCIAASETTPINLFELILLIITLSMTVVGLFFILVFFPVTVERRLMEKRATAQHLNRLTEACQALAAEDAEQRTAETADTDDKDLYVTPAALIRQWSKAEKVKAALDNLQMVSHLLPPEILHLVSQLRYDHLLRNIEEASTFQDFADLDSDGVSLVTYREMRDDFRHLTQALHAINKKYVCFSSENNV